MPKWIPERVWNDQDVFVIGGGNSLERFDWKLLEDENTIGCNDAFLHGSKVCKICVLGDIKWFKAFERRLAQYKGSVFTNSHQLQSSRIPWLWIMPRKIYGLHKEALGWNGNTGAVAINLALLLGAKRIFLLGFDMHLSKDGKSNWHKNELNKPNETVYVKFLKAFEKMVKDLGSKFSGVEIINVTDDSSLDLFPKIGVDEFWKGRKAK